MSTPLAELLRPTDLSEIVGQQHILGPGQVLREIIEKNVECNLIFYGPPGVGKTATAMIIANRAQKPFIKLNATTAKTDDIKSAIKASNDPQNPNGVLLYLDEIQYFTKKQQQTLLETTESGKIQLIASTTENPFFYVYNALLSRSSVFEFKPVSPEETVPMVNKALDAVCTPRGLTFDPEIPMAVAMSAGGDVRKAVSIVELLSNAVPDNSHIPVSLLSQISSNNTIRYDKGGDQTYDLASGLMKSMRGSDPDAALYYLARFVEAGDIQTPIRRILCSASEDVGLAYPQAVTIVRACVDNALQLGFPEARLPLAQAVIILSLSPKSNSVHEGINAACQDVAAGLGTIIPRNMQNVHCDTTTQQTGQNYLYPHDYPFHWVSQQYLPDDLLGTKYYKPGDNKTEQSFDAYWAKIKGVDTP